MVSPSQFEADGHRLLQSGNADHYSGVLVVTLPGRLDSCIEALTGLDGVTVSLRDPERDRMIVVLEAPSREQLEALHRQVSAVPGVVAADPIVHYVDDKPGNHEAGA
jgi:nitrate reductase NapAB chaperone NapD